MKIPTKEEEKVSKQINSLRNQGWGIRKLARKMGVGTQTIYNYQDMSGDPMHRRLLKFAEDAEKLLTE